MNRRQFFHNGFNALAMMALAGINAACARPSAAHGEKPMYYTYGQEPSLKTIAAKKLHHGKGIFINPFGPTSHGRFGRLLQWKLFSPNHFKKYYDQEPTQTVNIDWTPVKAHGGLSVTFLRHASILIKDAGHYILIDPIFGHISRFIKDFSPLGFAPETIPRPHQILVTHGHYDHLDKESLGHYKQDAHFISPLGYRPLFNDLGLKQTTVLDWFESVSADGRNITLLPCHHWTMRNPLVGPNRALWGSYLIQTRTGLTIYVAGDTGYFEGFKEIGDSYPIDLAIFNLGAYEPRWFMKPSHMNPAETVQAFRDLKAKKLMVVHWGTFRLGDEPVHFPPIQMRAALEKEGLLDHLVDIAHGQSFYFA